MLGSADAQYRLGMKFLVTTPPDYEKAEYWLRRAAIQGDTQAQKQLGRFYALGFGGQPDFVRAYLWLQVAAVLDAEAEYDRQLLARGMTKAQLTEAEALAAAYQPGHAPDEQLEAKPRAGARDRKEKSKQEATGSGKPTSTQNRDKRYFVKLGVFASRENAEALRARLIAQGESIALQPIRQGDRDLVAVRAGPYSSPAAARRALRRFDRELHIQGQVTVQGVGSAIKSGVPKGESRPKPGQTLRYPHNIFSYYSTL
jgi:cell division septation protein DedD